MHGQAAAVGARAFDLLVALIENRDRVVTKDELLDLVWPGVVVEENNLQVQVSTLRKILGAHAVATIPGRGYRFTLQVDDAGGVAPQPPKAAHNLPAPLNSFVGRESEIAAVRRLANESRLVTLTSIGGTGKTRLSLQVAAAMREEFADGAWLVELAPLADPRRVPQAIASVLGVTEEAGRPVIEALAKFVRDRRLLLVLDNCEHLLRACADVARQLLSAGANLCILASSREPLHVAGEAVYQVPALASPDAIRLFMDRAGAANRSFEATPANAATIVDICRRLDGLPLAIELAAARVRALSVDKIGERLDDCFRLLTGGDPTALPRQQTLRASIDWSHDLLSPPERALLRRLSVFAGGWALEAAEAVGSGGEVEADAALDLLANLVEKSLVSVDAAGERYHLLETVRQYALERLEASGEADAVRGRHLAFYLDLATRARAELFGPKQAQWYARFDQERDNVLAAHSWCDRAEGGEDIGLRLVSTIKQYWLSRGLLGLAYGIMLEALARAPARSGSRCRTLFDAGQVGYFMGLYGEARRHLEESVAIAREIGENGVIASALQPLGMACAGTGDIAAARDYLEEALRLARAQSDPRSVAGAVNMRAQLYRIEGDLDAAEPLYAHVLDLAREMGDRDSVAIGLLNLAMVAVDRGDAARARAVLGEALAIARSLESEPAQQSVLEVCAGLAAMAGDAALAARFYGAAERQASRTSIHRDPADDAFLQPWMEKARAGLGPDEFARLEGTGRARAFGEMLDDARAWLDASS